MIVVGGSYRETCERPRFRRVRGSGLRAALALRQLPERLELQTYSHPTETPDIEVAAAFAPFDLVSKERSLPVDFQYFTPLSPPTLLGRDATAAEPLVAADRTVLRFGLLERGASASIEAETLVVDPQGEPLGNSLDGSRFTKLAIVANEAETRRLGGQNELRAAAAQLRTDTGAVAVVTKCGARGALVTTADQVATVGSFPTTHVAPIGSGDVFAAAFAWAYGERDDDAVSAARFASRSTAHWCTTSGEPRLETEYPQLAELPFGDTPTVYLAGPFFSLAQTWLVDLVRDALLELGAQPFSPFHDVGTGGPEVAVKDLEGIDASASMIALLDEFDPGTLIEVGYAIRRQLPVVAYLDPPASRHLVMVEGSGVDVVDDLASAVYRAIWRGMHNST